MTTEVDYNPETGIVLICPGPDLNDDNRLALRGVVLKALANCPTAILIDLSGVRSISVAGHATLLSLHRAAGCEPTTPLMLCGPTGEAARRLATFGSVYPSVAAARLAAAGTAVHEGWRYHRLAAVAEAASVAGCLVADACAVWELPHLVMRARAVTFDLIRAALGRQDLHLTVRLRPRHLLISVRDYEDAVWSRVEVRREPLDPETADQFRRDGATAAGRLVVAAGQNRWATLVRVTG